MRRQVVLLAVLAVSLSAFAQKKGAPSPTGPSGSSSGSNVGSVHSAPGGLSNMPVTNTSPFGGFDTRSGGSMVYDPNAGVMRPVTPQEERLMRAMQAQRNLDRQKTMRSDTAKLVQLANSLQQDVNRDGAASADEQKKAGQIEKLAKSVKSKMTGEY